nr:vegetative cell wall protein gp1-like [Aegilops tauschii subsp. strangulata]
MASSSDSGGLTPPPPANSSSGTIPLPPPPRASTASTSKPPEQIQRKTRRPNCPPGSSRCVADRSIPFRRRRPIPASSGTAPATGRPWPPPPTPRPSPPLPRSPPWPSIAPTTSRSYPSVADAVALEVAAAFLLADCSDDPWLAFKSMAAASLSTSPPMAAALARALTVFLLEKSPHASPLPEAALEALFSSLVASDSAVPTLALARAATYSEAVQERLVRASGARSMGRSPAEPGHIWRPGVAGTSRRSN